MLCSVKEMDPGQIGLLIKVLNIGCGLALSIWAGVFMVLEIISYFNCGEDTVDRSCCPNTPEGAIVCAAPMSLFSNFSALVISIYMIPLGTILILYEVSTRRVGAQEVCDPVSVCPAALATAQLGFSPSGGSHANDDRPVFAVQSVAEPSGIWAKLASFRESLMLYFGFIFFYKRRTHFLVFVGILCLGNRAVDDKGDPGGSWAPSIAGGIALLNALLHFAVRLQHPEFDQSMQQALSAADDHAMGQSGGGQTGGAQQYTAEQEDIYQAPSAPTPSYAPAPAPVYAPAPAPAGGNIYGGDDGGTAI